MVWHKFAMIWRKNKTMANQKNNHIFHITPPSFWVGFRFHLGSVCFCWSSLVFCIVFFYFGSWIQAQCPMYIILRDMQIAYLNFFVCESEPYWASWQSRHEFGSFICGFPYRPSSLCVPLYIWPQPNISRKWVSECKPQIQQIYFGDQSIGQMSK